jgi:exopolysaccharide biosynthesis polyprenyl glycosylphosphotransferase
LAARHRVLTISDQPQEVLADRSSFVGFDRGRLVLLQFGCAFGIELEMGKRFQRALKRFTDIIASAVGLIVLAPLFLIVAAAIRLTSPGPVFFRQERVGRDGRIFSIFKFRTMTQNAVDHPLGYHTNGSDPRITPVGRFLRRYSLDELPQFINILKGEMSLVGPRPTLAYQVEKYTNFQKRRLLVSPGVTGMAQVNGRNQLTWPQRIERDVWYVDNWSYGLDLKILLKTVGVWLRREGVYNDGVPDEISQVG